MSFGVRTRRDEMLQEPFICITIEISHPRRNETSAAVGGVFTRKAKASLDVSTKYARAYS